MENCSILWLQQCWVASCLRFNKRVHHNLGSSVAQRRGKISGNFTLPRERDATSPYWSYQWSGTTVTIDDCDYWRNMVDVRTCCLEILDNSELPMRSSKALDVNMISTSYRLHRGLSTATVNVINFMTANTSSSSSQNCDHYIKNIGVLLCHRTLRTKN